MYMCVCVCVSVSVCVCLSVQKGFRVDVHESMGVCSVGCEWECVFAHLFVDVRGCVSVCRYVEVAVPVQSDAGCSVVLQGTAMSSSLHQSWSSSPMTWPRTHTHTHTHTPTHQHQIKEPVLHI